MEGAPSFQTPWPILSSGRASLSWLAGRGDPLQGDPELYVEDMVGRWGEGSRRVLPGPCTEPEASLNCLPLPTVPQEKPLALMSPDYDRAGRFRILQKVPCAWSPSRGTGVPGRAAS